MPSPSPFARRRASRREPDLTFDEVMGQLDRSFLSLKRANQALQSPLAAEDSTYANEARRLKEVATRQGTALYKEALTYVDD